MNVLQKVTLQTLKKNRTRTIVTIIGILLSTAMVTAVAASVVSFCELFRQIAEFQYGDWHVAAITQSTEETEKILNAPEVEKAGWAQQRGCVQLDDETKKLYPKAYMYIFGSDNSFEQQVAARLTDGQYPEKETEILLPSSLQRKYQLGDTVNFTLGQRFVGEQLLTQFDMAKPEEYFEPQQTQSFTVCGFYDDTYCSTNVWSLSAFTGLSSVQDESSQMVYLKLKNPRKYRDAIQESSVVNHMLLHTEGVFGIETSSSIKGFLGIVILLIMSASIALIYNAFSISVSERTRQLGLLSSVGTTKRQLASMVRYEAFAVSMVGIPLGILSGLGGIGVTFAALDDLIVQLLGDDLVGQVALRLQISPVAILLVVLISLGTVLISAQIPAKRATRVSAMDAIQQRQDIQATAKQVQVSELTKRVFGVPGMLAKKYFRRSHKKYRTTIFSLTMSVVLFVTGWSVIDHGIFTMRMSMDVKQYDLEFRTWKDELDGDSFFEKIQALPSIEQVVYISSAQHTIDARENGPDHIWVNFVSQNAWDELVQTYHLDPEIYNNPSAPLAIAVDGKHGCDPDTRKKVVYDFLKGDNEETVLLHAGGNQQRLFSGKTIEEAPWYMYNGDKTDASYTLIYPRWALDVLALADPSYHYKMLAEDVDAAEAELSDLMEQEGMKDAVWRIMNTGKERKAVEGRYFVIEVFAGGFIALLSLIAAANVFNTISTNISLRRRDFAMLKTVGMSEREFHKMMGFECILYGTKSLLYGLVISVLLILRMENSLRASMELSFRMPWVAVGIATVNIFALVLISIVYSVQKLKKESLIDTLKNENL